MIKSMMYLANSSANPQLAIQQMLQNNPQYNQILRLINENGGSPKAAFYSLANQMGIDPNQVINALK